MSLPHDNQTSAITVQRINPDGPDGQGLSPWEAMDPTKLAAGTPVQTGHLYDEDEAKGYSAGVWHCTPFNDAPGPYPVDEYMMLLEGKVVMAMPDGEEVTINAGEAFILPQGLDCQWKMPSDVRKVFMIVENDGRKTSQNASLVRVTKPALGANQSGADAIMNARCVFHSADGRMQVHVRTFPDEMRGPMPSASQRLITVLSGGVKVAGGSYAPMQSLFVDAADRHDWQISGGTTWIEAQYLAFA